MWTFKLRQNVTWQDGTPFTSADVVATMERLVKAGNSGLKGVIAAGSAVATDPNTVTFTLEGANGNFPYLVSVFNAQSLITPAAYAAGTTLDKVPAGTGAWKIESYDIASGAKFARNDKWWGGKTPLDAPSSPSSTTRADGHRLSGRPDRRHRPVRRVDRARRCSTTRTSRSSIRRRRNHREIWMRCDTGQFADKRVRQALALSIDRPALIQQLFKGKGELGQRSRHLELYPYYSDTVPQRAQDIAKAKHLLSDAGKADLKATLQYGKLQRDPGPGRPAAEPGRPRPGSRSRRPVGTTTRSTTLQWCPPKPADPPCSGAAEFGIVDYGHRATPDVFLNSAFKTKGVWNASQYSSPAFDAAFTEFQSAVGVDAQKAACAKIETIMNEDVPAAIPYWYNYLSGNSKKFTGVYTCALGQMFLSAASAV